MSYGHGPVMHESSARAGAMQVTPEKSVGLMDPVPAAIAVKPSSHDRSLTGIDAREFRAHVKPRVLGMPRAVAFVGMVVVLLLIGALIMRFR
jgi:hypothetical protein